MKSHTWHKTLSLAQVRQVQEIINAQPCGSVHAHGSHDGWSVYMIGTTGPPRYVELRYRGIDGQILKRYQIDAGTD